MIKSITIAKPGGNINLVHRRTFATPTNEKFNSPDARTGKINLFFKKVNSEETASAESELHPKVYTKSKLFNEITSIFSFLQIVADSPSMIYWSQLWINHVCEFVLSHASYDVG